MLSTTMDIYVDMIDTVRRDAASKFDGWFPTEGDGTTGAEEA